MLSINGKIFMNISEAVQWLLDNNALPFQSTANYVADTEIAKTTIINPSPAQIKIGSLVLFSDGKVGTVSGITSNGFKVGPESTDLSNGVPHITALSIDASGHLIATMSEGDPIDAGLIRQIVRFTIDATQHLVAEYNDGTSDDLGAIFSGNISITGDLTVSGKINNEPDPSVKPIYCHPIYLSFNRSATLITFTCLIFNNSPTALTINSFYSWCRNLFTSYPDASILASGFVVGKPISRIRQFGGNLAVETPNSDGTANDYWQFTLSQVLDGSPTFSDGVNKIN